MYIVNKLVAIITMLSSSATAIAMSALFTTYVAIAPDKATKRASQNCFKLIGDRSAWRKRPTGARSSLRIGTRISSSSASARSQNQAWAGRSGGLSGPKNCKPEVPGWRSFRMTLITCTADGWCYLCERRANCVGLVLVI